MSKNNSNMKAKTKTGKAVDAFVSYQASMNLSIAVPDDFSPDTELEALLHYAIAYGCTGEIIEVDVAHVELNEVRADGNDLRYRAWSHDEVGKCSTGAKDS